jgi:hypothetical protein
VEEERRLAFDPRDSPGLQRFLERSVTAGTLRNYDRMWGTWEEFWAVCRDRGLSGDPWLRGVTSDWDRKRYWLKYVWYLRTATGTRPGAIAQHLSAVRKILRTHQIDVGFADDSCPLVQDAVRAAKEQNRDERKRELIQREARIKLPAFEELIEWAHREFWCNSTWDWDGTERKAIWVALSLMDVFGLRQSNLVAPRPRGSDHAFRAEDFELYVVGDTGEELRVNVGDPEMDGIIAAQVTRVSLVVASAKRSVEAVRKIITRSDARGSRAIDTLVTWLKESRVEPSDILVTYRRVSLVDQREYVKTLTASTLGGGIKEAAVGVQVPPEYFSSRSLRKGLVTRGALEGEDPEVTAERGQWRSQTVMTGHYDSSQMLHRAEGGSQPLNRQTILAMLPGRGTGGGAATTASGRAGKRHGKGRSGVRGTGRKGAGRATGAL